MIKLTKFFSIYLIKGNDGDILIDTGFFLMKKKLTKILDKYNVKYIILTHAHMDHMWNAQYLKERYNAKVAIGEKDLKYLNNKLLKSNPTKWIYKPLTLFYRLGFKVLKPTKVEIDDLLKENDIIDKYGIKLKIIDLEGHTPGSIGIMDEENNLYCGDAAISRFRTVQKTWQNNDNQKAHLTTKKILDLEFNNIYFGHGKIKTKKEFSVLNKYFE